MNRIIWIDKLKGYAAFAVTLGHVLGGLFPQFKSVMFICYMFELPAFYIACGMLQKNRLNSAGCEGKDAFVTYSKGKIRQYLLSYILFSAFYILVDLGKLFLKKGGATVIWIDLIEVITMWGKGAMWFLPTFLAAELLFVLMLRHSDGKRPNAMMISVLILGILVCWFVQSCGYDFSNYNAPFYAYVLAMIARTLCGIIFIMAGYYCLPLIEKLRQIKKTKIWISVVAIVMAVLGIIFTIKSDRILDLHYGYMNIPVLSFMVSVLFVISISIMIEGEKPDFVCRIGKASITIMGLQLLWPVIVRSYSFVMDRIPSSMSSFLIKSIGLVLVIILTAGFTTGFTFIHERVISRILYKCKSAKSKS